MEMARMNTRFYSTTLDLMTTVNVIIPNECSTDRPPATLYLLHGLAGDSESWLQNTSLERYASQMNLIIIMPNGDRSFYTDMADGNRYWSYLTKELPAKMRSWFPVSAAPERCFVGGLSMGGYGALKWGLNFPEKFAGILSMSAAVDIKAMWERTPEHAHEFQMVFGHPSKFDHSINDLFDRVNHVSIDDGRKPEILQFCGTSDFLHADNLRFKAALDQSSIPHTYHEKTGASHEWAYWDESIQVALKWIEKKLEN